MKTYLNGVAIPRLVCACVPCDSCSHHLAMRSSLHVALNSSILLTCNYNFWQVRAKTLLCKAIGVTLSVSGGLPCGKEGPMVQVCAE